MAPVLKRGLSSRAVVAESGPCFEAGVSVGVEWPFRKTLCDERSSLRAWEVSSHAQHFLQAQADACIQAPVKC